MQLKIGRTNFLSNFTKKLRKCLIFSAYLSYRASKFKMAANWNIFLVYYIGCVDILNQKIRQIQAYHRKTYYDFNTQNHFCHTKLQTRIIKVVLSKFLYLIANWTSYPNPIKEALAVLKSALKLFITSF